MICRYLNMNKFYFTERGFLVVRKIVTGCCGTISRSVIRSVAKCQRLEYISLAFQFIGVHCIILIYDAYSHINGTIQQLLQFDDKYINSCL